MSVEVASLETPSLETSSLETPSLEPSSLETSSLETLAGCGRASLREALLSVGVTEDALAMRTAQVWGALYTQGVHEFTGVSTLNKPLRTALAERFTLVRPKVRQDRLSEDGTRKWLLEMNDGALVETVHIPDVAGRGRGALCVSSQVGCTLTCRFCHTGTQRLVRNLTAAEIVSQLLVANDALGAWDVPRSQRPIATVVFMGMGEPLYNLKAVHDAIDIMADGDGLGLSRRRITVSTAGVVPKMDALAQSGVMLAVSLHAATDELRTRLVPLNRKYPLAELREACLRYRGASNARRITFEYVLLKDVNDTDAHARALVRWLHGLHAKVNLIPFNPWPGAPFASSTRVEDFARVVRRAGYASPVRHPRGRDIMAACGQLKSACEKQ